MRKKLFILFAAACLTAAPMSVFLNSQEVRAEQTITSGDYQYSEKEDGTISITKYTGTDTELEIPAAIDGKPVTELLRWAFYDCTNLTSLTIPEGVVRIENGALMDCRNLVSISLPASMSWIGEEGSMLSAGRVFDGLSSLTEINVAPGNLKYVSQDGILCWKNSDSDSVKLVRVPEGKSGAIAVPDNEGSISWSSFKGCSGITELTFSGEVYTTRNGLKECSNLKKIHLSSDYTGPIIRRTENDDGGVGYFFSCQKFTEYTVDEGNTDYFAEDGILYEKSSSILISCPVGKRGVITIPAGTTRIGLDAFGECSEIRRIVIPDGVTKLTGYEPEGAGIYGCESLESVEIPASVTEIGLNMFYRCNGLKDIYFKGSQTQWDALLKDQVRTTLENIGTTVHCSGSDTDTSNSPTVIPVSSSYVTLEKTSVTYNGRAQMPSVVVKDGEGKVIGAANYTVTYSNNKNIGQASVTVVFKGNYTGTVTKTFDIVPKGTSISKVSAGKKSFTVKWKKQKDQTTGYEIRYSTDKNMKKAAVINNIKAKKTSQKVSKLKAKKMYYVQIRTYKTVNGIKYVSEWSKSRSVRTKK